MRARGCSAPGRGLHRAPRRAVPALRARIPHASARRGVLGVSGLRTRVSVTPSNRPRLFSHRAAPAVLLPRFARCAGGGAGLREKSEVPAPGAQRQARCAGDGSYLIPTVTGCARRNGFRHPVRRLSPAMHRCTRATGSAGYARSGSLSPALASSLRRVGRLRRAFVGGSAPHTPTCSRGRCDRCRGAAPARRGGHLARADRTLPPRCAVRRVKGRRTAPDAVARSVAR